MLQRDVLFQVWPQRLFTSFMGRDLVFGCLSTQHVRDTLGKRCLVIGVGRDLYWQGICTGCPTHTAPAARWERGREELRESKLLLLDAGEVLASLRDPGIWYVNTLEPLQDKAKEVI